MSTAKYRVRLGLTVIPCLLALAACAGGKDAPHDTVAAAPAATGGANANPIDTGMAATTRDSAGMHHDTMTNRAATRDSSQRTPSRQ